jgi:RecA-family ATPase
MELKDELPICQVGALEESREANWLIESLWLNEAAGIIGGQPKCGKSWLGLDMAVSVASKTNCLGKFPVTSQGPALIFLAEDSLHGVRARVAGICKSRDLDIAQLDVSVITAAALRLDDRIDCDRLWRAIEKAKPRLILLDPLVRLHRLDENNSRDIAGILGFLREIQRHFATAVVLTHHASKKSSSRPGQSLRGSSDLHAFGDSNLYLARDDEGITLTVEHRAAAAIDKMHLHLTSGDAVHLQVADSPSTTERSRVMPLEDRIINELSSRKDPVQREALRSSLRVNNQRFGQALTSLLANGRIVSTADGLKMQTT